MTAEIDSIPVHLTGVEDGIKLIQSTREVDPEHFVFRTAVIPPFTTVAEPGGEGAQVAGEWYQQILNEDPLRQDFIIFFPDGPAVLCHSEAQASQATNLTAAVPFPEGAYFATGSSTGKMAGTGPVWCVNTGTTVIRVSILTNRRGA